MLKAVCFQPNTTGRFNETICCQ